MSEHASRPLIFLREMRRRRVFRTAGLYIVGAWLVMQAADVFFPAWGLPDAALNVLLVAAILGFPLALVFGWFYDITASGIVRTPSAEEGDTGDLLALQRNDYLVLGALALIAALILYEAVTEILEAPRVAETADAQPDSEEAEGKPENSIAVLPFANVSNDAENEAFCDGISEEILHKLSEFGDLHVIGRTSSFAFKDSDYGIPKISRLLGVRYLLQGSVRKSGNQLRITAQLVDDTGVQRWSEAFDRRFEDIFAIQTEIADLVATTVVPRIVPLHAAAYEPDLEAYQHYLVGRDLLHRRDVLTAREELAKAVALDPDFAEAQAEYAISLAMWEGDMEIAQQVLDRALALKPGLPRARAAQGMLISGLAAEQDAEAERILRGVLADEPNMVDASNWLAASLSRQGKAGEALEVYERALRTDPLHPAIAANLAQQYQRLDRLDDAERLLLRLASVPEPSGYIVGELIDLYRATGRLGEMLTVARGVDPADSSDAYRAVKFFMLAESYALLGDFDAATGAVEHGLEYPPATASIVWWIWAALHLQPAIWQGHYAEAEEMLKDLFETHGVPLSEMPELHGTLLAYSGQHRAAQEVLEPLLDSPQEEPEENYYDALHTLAWSLQQTGQTGRARRVLVATTSVIEERERNGELRKSGSLFFAARNALLLGDPDGALDRMREAVDAGWREYYLHRYDPRLDALRRDPRYQALMSAVRADVDRQRAEVRERDAREKAPLLPGRTRATAE